MNQEVAQAIDEIANRHGGRVTPDLVVAEARNTRSVLHSYFEWDTKKAAEAHWLYRARELIRSVRVEVTTTTWSLKAPAYVRDPEKRGDEQGYASLARLRNDEDMARSAIVGEFSRAAAALARARAIAAALGLSEDIKEIQDRIIELSWRIEERPGSPS